MLELGGKSPNIVFDDAESGAVEGAANAIFFNHGQCCVAGSRLFVQEDRFDEVVNGVAEIAKGIKLGPGMEAGTQMGPLVSDEQLRRVTGFLESGISDGATTVTGGGRFGDQGYFVEPTVITNTRPDMKIVREEIFGPVVVAEPFRSLDEIAAEANNSTYGLGAGIWTKDISWTSPRPTPRRRSSAQAPSGSTATTSSTRPCRSAGTSSPAGAARWATRSSRPTPKSRQ
jgi:phenylacetaldehyde dehydrogenase